MVILFLAQIISAVIALFTIRMYSDFLNANDLGVLMLYIGGLALLDALYSSAISQVVYFYGSRKDTKYSIYTFLQKTARYVKPLGASLFLTIFFVGQYLTYPAYLIQIIFLLIIYFVIEYQRSGLFSLLNVLASRKVYAFQVMIDAISTLLLTFILLHFYGNYLTVIVAILISRYFSVFTNAFFLKKFHSLEHDISSSVSVTRKDIARHLMPISFMGLLGWLGGFADRYIVAATLSVQNTGYYSIATGLVGKPYNVSTSAFTAYFRPGLYKNIAADNKKEALSIQKRWVYSALIVGGVGTLFFYLFSTPITELLLANEFRGHVENLLWIIAISMTLSISTHVFDNMFLAKGAGKSLFRLQIFLAPLPLISIAVGAIGWGIVGAAFGRLCAELVELIFVSFYFKRLNK